jgi:GDP-L-fucose synthase
VFLLERYSGREPINVGSNQEIRIRALAETICATAGFRGRLRFDPSCPDRTPRKLTDCEPLTTLGWRARICLPEGLAGIYRWFLENVAAVELH